MFSWARYAYGYLRMGTYLAWPYEPQLGAVTLAGLELELELCFFFFLSFLFFFSRVMVPRKSHGGRLEFRNEQRPVINSTVEVDNGI